MTQPCPCLFLYLLALGASPGAGGAETGASAGHSSSTTARLIQDARRVNPLWKSWREADARAAETSL